MRRATRMGGPKGALVAATGLLALSACAPGDPSVQRPRFASRYYRGIETRLLEGNLVNFRVYMNPMRARQSGYRSAMRECAAAQYTH